jgi:hypothetical protein
MNNISAFFSKAWRPALLVVSLGLIGYVLYFHNLYGLVPGYAQVEVASYRSALSWRDIAANPLDLPYKAIVYTLNLAGHHSLVITRAAAALCSLLAVTIFFCITRAWYGFRIAFFGAMLFATSAGFLHFARLGSAQVLQMGLLVLIGIMVWHRRAPRLHPYLTYLAALETFIIQTPRRLDCTRSSHSCTPISCHGPPSACGTGGPGSARQHTCH